jgi:anti-sigma B factor antagonist
MKLSIDRHEREGILILGLDGQLTIGPENLELREEVQSCIAAGRTKIVIDCSRLRSIDSSGLDALVHVSRRCAGGKIVLLKLVRTRMDLSILAKLGVVFEVFPDEQEAVNSFFPDRALQRFDILQFVQEQPGHQESGN